MPVAFRTITGPVYWASALVNGDFSGLDTEESALCKAWQERELEPGESIVSCADEPRFTWSYRLYGGNAQGGDVIEYTALKP